MWGGKRENIIEILWELKGRIFISLIWSADTL